ncbi:MAG: hypothetical protein LBJ77_01720 [Holosporales bacterium]|nr:hypothetical protein [Holosporales bacterium]
MAAVVNAFHLLPPPIRYYTTRYPNGRTSTPSEAEDSYPLADGEDQGNMASDAPETRRSSRAGGTDASAFPNGAEGRGPRYPSRVIGVKTRGVLPPPGRSELAYWRIGYQALVHLVADLQLAMDSYGAYPDCREHPLFTTAAALVRAFYSSPPPFNLELPQWFQDGMTIWSSDEEDQGQMTSGSPELRSSRTGVSDEIASNMDDPLHRADEHADGTIPEEGESKRPPAEEESRGDLRPEPLIDAK